MASYRIAVHADGYEPYSGWVDTIVEQTDSADVQFLVNRVQLWPEGSEPGEIGEIPTAEFDDGLLWAQLERLAEQYKDQPILFELSAPAVPEGAEEQEIREIARAFVLRHKNHRVGLLKRGASQAFLDAIYEYSRRLYSGEIL